LPPDVARRGATQLLDAADLSVTNLKTAVSLREARGGGRLTSVLLGAALIALAASLRLYQIDRAPIWLDEGYTLLFSRLSPAGVVLIGGAHEHPPLYYLLVHLVLSLRDSAYMPRVLSAAAGAVTVLALYLLAARLYNRLAGALAATLLAISPFHVWFGRDGRGYALAGLFVLLSYLLAFTALERPRRATWVVYAVCLALAAYTEYATVFALAPQAFLMVIARRRHLERPLYASWLASGLLVLPWLVRAIPNAAAVAAGYWVPQPTLDSVGVTATEFLGLAAPCIRPPCPASAGVLGLATGYSSLVAILSIGAACLLVAVALARRDTGFTVVTLWLVVPFAAVLLLSIRRSLYIDRVFLDASFPVYLLAGARLSALIRRPESALPAIAVLALWTTVNASVLSQIYQDRGCPNWKGAAQDFGSAYRPGQSVVFYPGVVRQIVAAYLPRDWRATAERTVWLHNYLDVPGWQRRYGSMSDDRLRALQLALASRGEHMVWLIAQGYTGLASARHWFTSHGFELVLSEFYSGDVRIELYDRYPPQTFGKPLLRPGFLDPAWTFQGTVRLSAKLALSAGKSVLRASFPLRSGHAYTVRLEYRAAPPACPKVTVRTYDGRGRSLGPFPRTKWYDLPLSGVWLSQPFGFVAPPQAQRADIALQSSCGLTRWRNVAVYGEP